MTLGWRRIAAAFFSVSLVASVLAVAGTPHPAGAAELGSTDRVSVDSAGAQTTTGFSRSPDISDDGRYVVFESTSPGLVVGDTNGSSDVFRRDTETGATTLVSQDTLGGPASGHSINPATSGDGRYVVFYSAATDLVTSPPPPGGHVYRRDLTTGTTILVSSNGATPLPGIDITSPRGTPAISDDGDRVVFVAGDGQVWLREVGAGTAHLISHTAADLDTGGAFASSGPTISGDGSIIAFWSDSTELVAAFDSNGQPDTFVSRFDAGAWRTTRVDGPSGQINDWSVDPSLSRDGTVIAFVSQATNVVADADGFNITHVYAATVDKLSGTVSGHTLVDVNTGHPAAPTGANGGDYSSARVSADGTKVAFSSRGSNLDAADLNGVVADVFLRDLATDRVELVSVADDGSPGDNSSGPLDPANESSGFVDPGHGHSGIAVNADGTAVAFESRATNLVSGDTNGTPPSPFPSPSGPEPGDDVFVRGIPRPIANLSLSVLPSTGPAGVSAIPTADIDLGALPLAPGQLESAPLHSSPLHSSPLHSSPLHSSPLHSSPLRDSPLRWSPLHSSPLHSSPIPAAQLPPMPLSSVPLFLDGGWEPRLVGTPLEGFPLTAVLLQDVIDLAGQTTGSPPRPRYPLLAELGLGDIDIGSTPLRSAPINAFILAGPSLDQLSTSADWCREVASATFSCTTKGVAEATATLLDLVLAGADPAALDFVAGLLVRDADLTGSVIAGFDVASVDVAATSLGAIPVTNLPPGMVDCALLANCNTATLADAVAADAIFDTADAVLGRILADPRLAGSLTFSDLVRSVVDPAKLDYSGLPLDALLTQAPLGPAGLVEYTAEADVRCDTATGLTVTVHLPDGFRYVPGSATRSVHGSPPVSAGDPAVLPPLPGPRPPGAPDGPRLQWPVGGATCADRLGVNHVAHRFQAQPGVTLGLQASDVTMASTAATAARRGVAPFGVTEVFEPNDDPASATPISSGVLYLSHISTVDDVDFYVLPPGLPTGTRVSAVLSHLPADFDLLLDGPVAPPLHSSPLHSSPLHSSAIDDFGLTGDRGGEVIEPDVLQDVPLRPSVLSQSATGGLESEQVDTILTAPTTAASPVTFEVVHHLRTRSDQPYVLRVFAQPPPELHCADEFVLGDGGGEAGALPTLTPDDMATGRTLYLINEKRFGDLYTSSRTAQVREALEELAVLPGESRGVIVPVEGDADVARAYDEWDDNRCAPEAANDVVRAIAALVERYAVQMPDLRYIALVGNDDAIPFARIPDGAVLSNQRDYAPEVVFAGEDNPISAAFALGYVLSDNVLGARRGVAFLGHQLPIPDLATGRLVETPDEILAVIAQYEAQPFVTLDRTLTTGYDFLADAAQEIDTILGRAQAAQQLPPDHAQLIGETWRRSDLLGELNAGPTVAAVNAHFDHSNVLPASAAGGLLSSTDLRSAALPPGALLFTLGCQGGLNVPGRAWLAAPNHRRLLDFAQVLAQKQAGGFEGNTGYGYGDDVELAYSERFLALFVGNFDGSMTVAQAAAKAKRDYLATGLVSVYDEKILAIATFYGLPFVTVGPSGVGAPPPSLAPGTVSGTFFGLPAHPFTWQEPYTLQSTERGAYYSIGDSAPLVAPYRPIQPADVVTLPNPPAGTQVGDMLITDLVSLPDEFTPDPVFSIPTVDQGAYSPEPLVRSVNFPASLGTVTPVGSLALFPGQYRSGSTPGTGTQLRFESMEGAVFYPSSPSDEARPLFREVHGTSTSTGVTFRVEVSPASYLSVLYRETTPDFDGNFTWGQVALEQVGPGSEVWTASVAGVEVAEYFVQAVDDGFVATTRAKGLDYVPVPEANVTVAGTQGDNGWYTGVPDPVTVDVAAVGATFTVDVNGAGEQAVPAAILDDGVHVIGYTGSNGATGSLTVPLDASAPTAHFFEPSARATYVVGSSVTASFRCADVHAGVRTCEALDPLVLDTSPGTHTFRVQVTDNAGNAAVRSVTYSARYTFEGFFAPLDNPEVWNIAVAGRTVPVKFRLRPADGSVVTDTAAVETIQSAPVACATGSTDSVESYTNAGTSGLRFDETSQQFVYSWKTQRGWADTCRKLVVTMEDGSSRFALFQFRR